MDFLILLLRIAASLIEWLLCVSDNVKSCCKVIICSVKHCFDETHENMWNKLFDDLHLVWNEIFFWIQLSTNTKM